MPHADKSRAPEGEAAAGRTAASGAPATLADHRPDALVQQRVAQGIAQSPRLSAQRAAGTGIDASPRLSAQRQRIDSGFGPVAQKQGEAEKTEKAEEAPAGKAVTPVARLRGADGKAHTAYLEGEPGNEQLMIASTPQQLLQVLTDHLQNFGAYYVHNGLIDTLVQTSETCSALIRHLAVRIVNRGDAWEPEKELLLGTIRTNLGILSTHLMWGSTDWYVDWIKPPTAHYPPVWIGPQAAGTVLQSALAWYRHNRSSDRLKNIREVLTDTEWQQWVGVDNAHTWDQFWYHGGYWLEHMPWPTVHIYFPNGGGTLPNGTDIGLADANQIYDGRQFDLDGNTGTTPGGTLINNALGTYGFKPITEGLDGDHAREIQLGGADALSNLWPLEHAPNRAGGVWLNTTNVYDGLGHSMPYPVLSDLVGAGALPNVRLIVRIATDAVSERWNWRS
ncbi:MAG: hypothetical protein V4864_06050 [Pseudomonadota bacterium]